MLDYTERHAPGTLDAVRALVPPESLRAIDTTPGVSWLPFEHDHWLMDGTIAVLGQDRAIRAWHHAMAAMLDRPVLRNFVQAGLRLFGGEPEHVLQLFQKGWTLVYRDFCEPSVRRVGAGHAELRFERIAPQVFHSEGYLHCWHAVCLGVWDTARARDASVAFEIDRGRAEALATFRWS
jgi:hypothetical protein